MRKSKDGLPNVPGSILWRIVATGLLGQFAGLVVVLVLSRLMDWERSWGSMVGVVFITWMMVALSGAQMAYKRGLTDGMKRAPVSE